MGHGVYYSSWLSCPSSVVAKQIRSRPDEWISFLCSDRCLQALLLRATVCMWNALPATLIQSRSIQSFKAGISAYQALSHVTIDPSAWYSSHRGTHYIGRWRYWRWTSFRSEHVTFIAIAFFANFTVILARAPPHTDLPVV